MTVCSFWSGGVVLRPVSFPCSLVKEYYEAVGGDEQWLFVRTRYDLKWNDFQWVISFKRMHAAGMTQL